MTGNGLGAEAVQNDQVVSATAALEEVSPVIYIHTYPCVLLESAMLFSHFEDVPIELDDINQHLREVAMEEPGQRAAAQAAIRARSGFGAKARHAGRTRA